MKQLLRLFIRGIAPAQPAPAYFKIGSGGFAVISGSGVTVPKDPADPGKTYSTKTDLEVPLFTKALIPADLTFVAPSTLSVNCFVALLDPAPGPPVTYFEIGVFDGNNVLLAYGTFPGEQKLLAGTISHVVSLNF